MYRLLMWRKEENLYNLDKRNKKEYSSIQNHGELQKNDEKLQVAEV